MLSTVLTSHRWLGRALAVWACGAIFYCYQYILRVSTTSMTDDLMHEFGVQGCALGILGAFYYNAYATLQVPVGITLDRFGTRKIVSGSILLCGVGCFFFAQASGLYSACFGRLLMGAGSACAFIGSIKLITVWFPAHHVARMVGFTMTLGTLGATFGVTLLPRFFEAFGWRDSMLMLGGIGLALAVASWFLFQPKPNAAQSVSQEEGPAKNLLEGLQLAVSTPQVWFLALFGCLMYVPLAAFADLWGLPFLTRLYKIERAVAGSYISAIYWGVALGGMSISALSDKLKCRRALMRAGAFLSFILYSLIILVPMPAPVMVGLLFMAGFSFGGQLLCFTAVTETLPLWASGVALGFTNMVIMGSGVFFTPLVGMLLDYFWDGVPDANGVLFSVEAFRTALIPVLVGLVGAFGLTFFIKETHPAHHKRGSNFSRKT
jgi:sugar phosphate permease